MQANRARSLLRASWRANTSTNGTEVDDRASNALLACLAHLGVRVPRPDSTGNHAIAFLARLTARSKPRFAQDQATRPGHSGGYTGSAEVRSGLAPTRPWLLRSLTRYQAGANELERADCQAVDEPGGDGGGQGVSRGS